ncbi:MAG: hypothetical protein ABEJ22_07970 [Haloferacaceae archaeon]
MSDSDDPRPVEADAGVDVTESGTSARTVLLLSDASVAAERQVCESQLSSALGQDTSILAVTYTEALDDVVEKVWESLGDLPADLGVISFDDMTRSSSAESGYKRPEGPITLTTMSDPENLKGLGTAMRLYLDEWTDRPTERVLCFNALTNLLRHVSLDDAFQFVEGVGELLEETDAVGYFHLDPSAVDDATRERIRTAFDVVVEGGRDETETGLEMDVVHRLLGNERRRFALAYLWATDMSVTVRTLTENIASWELGVAASDLSSLQTERVRTSLTTSHVPLMKDAGVVATEDDGEVLRLTDRARGHEALTSLLEMAAEEYDVS